MVAPARSSRRNSDAAKKELEHTPFVLAAGEPRIAQLRVDVSVSGQADAQAGGGATASASASGGGKSQPYGYAGVRPTKFDDAGTDHGVQVLAGRLRPAAAEGQERRRHGRPPRCSRCPASR